MAGSRPILLIVGNGQVGWELQRSLAPLGRVMTLDRAGLDLASPDAIRAVLRQISPGLVVNAAAYTAVDRAEQEVDLAQAINGTAPGVMAEEAKRLDAALVHYSTDYVFDGMADRPWREDDPTGPLSVYGRSKLAGETAIRAVGGAHLILRTSWVYAMRGHNFLLTMRRLAVEREELRVVDDQTGAPTWARGIAEATALILARARAAGETGELAERRGVYHLATGGMTSWHGFATAIVERLRASGAPMACRAVTAIPTSAYPTPARRPAWSVLDCGKLRDAFAIALPDWREQLDLCLAG